MNDPLAEIERGFADLDRFYPGSKKTRRTLTPEYKVKPKPVEEDAWDASPTVKRLPNGRELELFTIGALEKALGRPLVTIRLWERKGYIPRAPYRLREAVVHGRKVPGRRMYSRALIEETVEAFKRHGVMDKARIEWTHHEGLSIELLETWTRIHNSETA